MRYARKGSAGMKGFLMTAAIAEKFFQRCLERKAVTTEDRLKIMNELIYEENIKILNEKGLKKIVKGKKVLVVKNQKRPRKGTRRK